MSRPSGVIIYEGPSVLDGQPIVAIATLNTRNKKTGDMVQTWIIRSDLSPTEASKAILDGSVCGSCPHRQSLGGACYVNLGHAPLTIYKAYKRGAYPTYSKRDHFALFMGRSLRLGAYGDPAAVPFDIWEELTEMTHNHTGYTHQIGHKAFDLRLLDLCMVSADTPKAAAMHQKFGRRTFRVKTTEAELLPNEIECVSDSHGLTCADCGLCDGAKSGGVSIAINVHGAQSKRYVEKYGKVNLIAVA